MFENYSFLEKPVGVVVVFKAMGVTSDQEIMQMVGTEDKVMTKFAACLEECHQEKIFTQGSKIPCIKNETDEILLRPELLRKFGEAHPKV